MDYVEPVFTKDVCSWCGEVKELNTGLCNDCRDALDDSYNTIVAENQERVEY